MPVSDYRSSNIAPSDSEREGGPRRDSDALLGPRLMVGCATGDSESGGSHSPSPRATRRRQVYHFTFFKGAINNYQI